MESLKKLKEQSEIISAIENITLVFQEIAHAKMMEIRREVLKTREFLEELARVYYLIKKSYLFYFKKGLLKKKKNIYFIGKKKGTALIFLSANEFFYGSLILDIWAKVYDFWKKNKGHLIIVGRLGKYLAENQKLGHKMFYFELNDQNPEEENIKKIIEFVKKYEKILVFHGKFETILKQVPKITDISGSISFEEKEVKNYLFEPSPETVLEFFETEIVATLFNQTILEHSLAKNTARMIAMYQASQNIKNLQKNLETQKKIINWLLFDKKQIEIFSGFKLWNRKDQF